MKKALIVVDYQNDFVSGSLGFDGAELLCTVIEEKIKSFYKQNMDVYFTFDTHAPDYLETREGKKLPISHCIEGTEGWKIYPVLEKYLAGAKAIIKKKTFGSLLLGKYLEKEKYDEVELCGLVSDICVISNAIIAKAALPEAVIAVDRNASSSFDKEMNDKAFDIMKGLQIEVRG